MTLFLFFAIFEQKHMQVLDIDEIKKEYSFFVSSENENKDIYFCNCGAIFEGEFESASIPEVAKNSIEEEYDEFSELFKNIKLTENENCIICKSCGKNFSSLESQKKTIPSNFYFISGYNLEEIDDDLFLYYAKYKAVTKKNGKKKNNYILSFESVQKYIRFNITTKKIYFKDYDFADEIEIDLNEIVKITDNIFLEEVKNIYNLFQIQVYIGKLAKHVIDVNNTNVVEELLGEMKNRFNYAGLDSIKKIISIFFGIIRYSNLSTIALTKGCKFLYDLMKECNIPSSEKLRELNLTSPIPIFNYLVSNYIKKINEEVNEDNREVHEFLFKSSQIIKMEIDKEADLKRKPSERIQEVKSFEVIEGDEKEMKIIYKENKDYQAGKLSHNANSNKFHVMEISTDANASKFIYKTIQKFSDYKQLLKYFKFYNKQEIISLLQKHDLETLTQMIDLIYFRDSMEIKEFERILLIVKDFATQETLKYSPTLNMENFRLDYSYFKKFDFNYYDDSLMMMEVLEFDPRKEFNKIKTFKELKKYHDDLVKYFNVVTDKEKNKKFQDFVFRFKFLESREDYDGNLEFKLISSPAMLVAEGQQMKHSASSYSRKVITESYLIGQIFDHSPNLSSEELKRFTIGFTFDSINGLEFHQIKGIMNKPGSDRFKKLLMEFLKTKDISFRPVRDLKLTEE